MASRHSFRDTLPALQLLPLWYAFGAFLLFAVALLSLMPVPPSVGVGDKTSHLLTYALLCAWFGLLQRSLKGLLIVVLALSAYGMMIELLQGLTGYRYAEWADVLANSIGCLLGTVAYASPLRGAVTRLDNRLASSIRR